MRNLTGIMGFLKRGGEGIGGVMDKYLNKTLKAKDIVPDFINKKIGEGFSNAKLPAGYESAVEPSKFVMAGLNALTGGPDERLWNKDMNPPLEQDQVPVGNQYSDISEFNIRDFLNRRGFGMDLNKSGRGKTLDELGLKDAGNNRFLLDRLTKTGDKFYKKFDPEAEKWAREQIGVNTVEGSTGPTRGFKPSRFEGKKWPVMANVSNNDVRFGGEGEDENGYYNLVQMGDKFDYALHPDEKINSPINLGRSVIDQFMNPAELLGQKKVYIKGIKKQPRKKKTGDNTAPMMDADII